MSGTKFQEMSLIEHITELRRRLLWSFVYILIIFIICFYFADLLFAFLAYPLVNLLDTDNGQGFIYTALQEAFFTELKIALFFALFFSGRRATCRHVLPYFRHRNLCFAGGSF